MNNSRQSMKNMKSLPYAGKRMLVTGSGRRGRVGAHIARYFAQQGCGILLHYRSHPEEAQAVKEDIERATGAEVSLISGDLASVKDVRALFAEAVPDIVVNNAAVFEPAASGDLADVSRAVERNVAANLAAPLMVSAEAVRRMRQERKEGVVVFVGDAFVGRGGAYPEGLEAYTASKAWVGPVVSQLAAAHGKHGVRFLAVLNGPVEPPPSAPASAVKTIADEIHLPAGALNPWLGGQAVAEAIHSLIQARGVNGATLTVDGGRAWRAPSEH